MRKTLLPCLLLAACTDTDLELGTAVAELGRPGTCEAKLFEPGIFSTEYDEGRLVFSLDGKHAYFHRQLPEGLRLMESHRSQGRWSTPTLVSFSDAYDDVDPFLTLDGQTLYFASLRPTPGSPFPSDDQNLWKVERTGSGWGAPIFLGDVNTEANELFPSLTVDGRIYFNSDREGGAGAWDLWTAPRRGHGFGPAQALPGQVNTGIWEYNPSPSPGGAVLAFASLDPDPLAPYSDVFFAVRFAGQYGARIDAGPCVNTILEEYHPTLDVAGGRLIFVRRDAVNAPPFNGDFYEVKLPALFWAQ
jgi:WD40-like Beta Propeller Repeat